MKIRSTEEAVAALKSCQQHLAAVKAALASADLCGEPAIEELASQVNVLSREIVHAWWDAVDGADAASSSIFTPDAHGFRPETPHDIPDFDLNDTC